MMPGVPERRTHSYVRHGTTSLFAALDVASGFVIGKCYKRHRAVEFLKFLKEIDDQVPEGLDVHIVMDNYATHKTPKIKAWLARRPHYHVHFTPTSASWINQVERWFAELTRKQISEAFTLPSGSSRPTSVPSSTGTTKTRSLLNGPSLLTRFWLQSNASVTKPSRLYVVNFRFT
jgi:transposase